MHNTKSEDFKYIEECISYIMQKEDIAENIRRIENALQRIFYIPFNVSISQNDIHEFFAVNVFPSNKCITTITSMLGKSLTYNIDSDDKYTTDMFVESWQKNCNEPWQIELDVEMLYSFNNKYSPVDIVTAMVHEIIRIVYTPFAPVSIYVRFKKMTTDVNRVIRALFKEKKIQKLLKLAILEACESKIFAPIDSDSDCESETIREMMQCLGYCDDYEKLIDKFISDGKTSTFVYRTYMDVKKDIRVILTWIITIIKELEFNKKRLEESLNSEIMRASSQVVKLSLMDIKSSFFDGDIDNYRLLLSEQWNAKPVDNYAAAAAFENLIKSCKRIVAEAANSVFDKNGKIKKISQLDIDVLAVDADRIETHDDKIYLLDRIYDKLQIVEAGLDYIDSGDKDNVVKQSKGTLLDMKKQLEDIRKVVLTTRIIEKEYGVFIKYPKGYEG